MTTYQKFRDEVDALIRKRVLGPVLQEVDLILDVARINADDTVYLEKSVPVSEWQNIATDTIRSSLSYEKNLRVVAWFARRGFKW